MQELNRPITKFEDIPKKGKYDTRIISYNILSHFWDDKDQTSDQRHIWENRKEIIYNSLTILLPDIMCIQELSSLQASELYKYFSKSFDALFLSQTPSEIPTGYIAKNNEIDDWVDKFIGTPIVGTLINKNYEISDQGRFWLNENPDQVPMNKDRGETDKGFGNMNTYRAILWCKVTFEGKELFIFNSHYPLSGGNITRKKCAILERKKIEEIAQDSNWVSCGDKNIIPTKDDDEDHNPHSVYQLLVKGAYDIRDHEPANHYGRSLTWLGFSYDNFIDGIDPEDLSKINPLDIMFSNSKAKISFSDPLGYKPGSKYPLALSEYNAEMIEFLDKERYFASDHSLIGADFEF